MRRNHCRQAVQCFLCGRWQSAVAASKHSRGNQGHQMSAKAPHHGTAIQQLPIIIKHNRPNERGNGSPHITYELYDVNMLLNAAVFRYSNSATAVSCRGPAGEPRWPLRNSWRGCKVYATNILPSSCGLRTANRPDVLNVSTLPCLSQSSSVTKELKGWRKGRPFCARD